MNPLATYLTELQRKQLAVLRLISLGPIADTRARSKRGEVSGAIGEALTSDDDWFFAKTDK
jgi:hypothetical protein